MKRKRPLLLGTPGCGSVIVEGALTQAKIAYDYEEVDYEPGSATRDRLLAVNPLGQVPALVLPDGSVLTESAAIIHYAHDRAPRAGLIPPRGDPARAGFYRWLFFLVCAVYPTFTYGDDTRKWVPDDAGSKLLRESTERRRQALWRQVEAAAGKPWFLGRRRSALDLYLAVMTRWRPGRKWFVENTPRVIAIAERVAKLSRVGAVIRRDFG
jgi:GST-like protein